MPDVMDDRATDALVPAEIALLRDCESARPALFAELDASESASPALVADDCALEDCDAVAAVYVHPCASITPMKTAGQLIWLDASTVVVDPSG